MRITDFRGITKTYIYSPDSFTYNFSNFERDDYNGRCYQMVETKNIRSQFDLVRKRISKAEYEELLELAYQELLEDTRKDFKRCSERLLEETLSDENEKYCKNNVFRLQKALNEVNEKLGKEPINLQKELYEPSKETEDKKENSEMMKKSNYKTKETIIRNRLEIKKVIYYYDKEKTKVQYIEHYKDNVLHNENDEPCKIWCYKNGQVAVEEYWSNGKCTRANDKPTIKEYYENGKIQGETYMNDGEYHRDGDKPAITWYHENGKKQTEQYYKNDKLHRSNAPAVIWYDQNGNIAEEYYFENGEEIIKDDII